MCNYLKLLAIIERIDLDTEKEIIVSVLGIDLYSFWPIVSIASSIVFLFSIWNHIKKLGHLKDKIMTYVNTQNTPPCDLIGF